jgi:hypothetical protein
VSGVWAFSDETIALALLSVSHLSGWLFGGGAVGLLMWRRRRLAPSPTGG